MSDLDKVPVPDETDPVPEPGGGWYELLGGMIGEASEKRLVVAHEGRGIKYEIYAVGDYLVMKPL